LANPSVDELAPEFDEYAVVEAAKRGDHSALAALYEHFFPRVYRYVASRLGNVEDAEDVTEEIFLRVIDNVGSFTWRGLPFGAWVFRIARNEIVSHVRRQKPRSGTAELSDTIADERADHTGKVEDKLVLVVVRKAMTQLPEAQRQVVELRFIAGLSVAETAKALNKTENNVKVLQHKAIAKLQVLVKRP
jgi:RNA polymerase sigma-70 factor (ECF subfamily)